MSSKKCALPAPGEICGFRITIENWMDVYHGKHPKGYDAIIKADGAVVTVIDSCDVDSFLDSLKTKCSGIVKKDDVIYVYRPSRERPVFDHLMYSYPIAGAINYIAMHKTGVQTLADPRMAFVIELASVMTAWREKIRAYRLLRIGEKFEADMGTFHVERCGFSRSYCIVNEDGKYSNGNEWFDWVPRS